MPSKEESGVWLRLYFLSDYTTLCLHEAKSKTEDIMNQTRHNAQKKMRRGCSKPPDTRRDLRHTNATQVPPSEMHDDRLNDSCRQGLLDDK